MGQEEQRKEVASSMKLIQSIVLFMMMGLHTSSPQYGSKPNTILYNVLLANQTYCYTI
jgi:hypothetical protein